MRSISKVVILLLTAWAILSCSSDTRPLEVRLQAVLDEKIADYDTRGVSAAIIMPGKPIWKGVAGTSHDTVRISQDMLFGIGSVTKNAVAALTLRLAEEGVLSLEDSLHHWLPPYPHAESTITIRQLLNHTSGVYMFWSNQEIWDALKADRYKVWTPDEVLSYIQEPYFKPGGGWRYSNTNYLLLAMIINKATGQRLSDNFRNYLWEPLDLKDVYLSIEDSLPGHLAHMWGDNFDGDGSMKDITLLPNLSHESICYGSSGLFMNAESLARWADALFGGSVLSESSLNQMLTFVDAKYGMAKYGLGVALFKRRLFSRLERIGHSGGNIGATTYMVHLPVYDATVVVMINRFESDCIEDILGELVELVVNDARLSKNDN